MSGTKTIVGNTTKEMNEIMLRYYGVYGNKDADITIYTQYTLDGLKFYRPEDKFAKIILKDGSIVLA